MAEQRALAIDYGPQGEIIILFPDGSRDHTNLVPSDDERRKFEAFFGTTVGRSLLMENHERAANDGLTKLLRAQPARSSIEQTFERLSTIQFDGVVSVIMLDLDDFRLVNKLHGGNPAGDQVLVWFADILKKCIRLGDVLARWGGDEFLILAAASKREEGQSQRERDQPYSMTARVQTGATLPNIQQPFGNGKMIAERIHAAMKKNPCFVDEKLIPQTATIGVANAYIKPGFDPETLFDDLLRHSNHALYQGKMSGKRDEIHVAPMIHSKPKSL